MFSSPTAQLETIRSHRDLAKVLLTKEGPTIIGVVLLALQVPPVSHVRETVILIAIVRAISSAGREDLVEVARMIVLAL